LQNFFGHIDDAARFAALAADTALALGNAFLDCVRQDNMLKVSNAAE